MVGTRIVQRWVDNLLEDPQKETMDESDSQENEETPSNPAVPNFDGDSEELAVVAKTHPLPKMSQVVPVLLAVTLCGLE